MTGNARGGTRGLGNDGMEKGKEEKRGREEDGNREPSIARMRYHGGKKKRKKKRDIKGLTATG